jgi:putative nucleotidyltransferase with HDIG domain
MPDRILVVDDEEPIREIVASMLGTAGYACKQAASGMEALAVLSSGEEFELMLSDLMMADLDGIGLLERTKERYPDMPVVMVTAVHDISVALRAIRDGAYDYLLKPFEREQLLNTVSRALENRRLKVENRTYQTNLESLVKARTDQLQAAMASLERSYDITLEALGDALDLKDRETEGHSKRVTAFTIAIARAMGLPRDQINTIARGAFLHDIGKMAIPDKILNKPGKLEPHEFDIMREHAFHGYQIVKKIPFLAEAAEIVFSHQEKFDGTGYPRGLKGEQIPLGARIFSVADTLDAITSDRIYRPAQTLQAAREEIAKWAGRQFDPEVVKVFLEMPDNIWDDLRREIHAQIYRVSYTPGPKTKPPNEAKTKAEIEAKAKAEIEAKAKSESEAKAKSASEDGNL